MISFVGNDMGQGMGGRAWLRAAALVVALGGGVGSASARDGAVLSNAPETAAAANKSVPAKAAAPLTGEAAIRAKCSELADNARAGTAIVGVLAAGIVGGIVVSALNSDSISKQEAACVRMKGDMGAVRQEQARFKDLPKTESAPKRASTSASPSRSVSASGSTCACPQMTTCSGSWATLTCSQLKNRCRNANSPMTYTVNGCDRLKELVGEF
jgi:hypothetical protein